MGLLGKLRGTGDGEAKAPPKAIVAAAMPLSGPGVIRIDRGRRQDTQEAWQRDAWYYWDVVGELRAPTVWIANAISQADVFATSLDPDTGKPTGPSDNQRAIAVATRALGGPSQRAGILRTLALCWQVVGEAWLIIHPGKNGKPDRWLAMSGNRVTAHGERWQYTDPYTGAEVILSPNDRLIRIWCPHPDDQAKADSSVRPALPILREIEKASQNIAARLDSRLASNGILLMADDLDYPKGDFDTSGGAVMDFFMAAAEANLQNPGQASAQVPLIINAPGELIGNGGAMAHIDISTAFDAAVVELRDNGRQRLANALDMPKAIAEGTQSEANHWSAWQVSEDLYKIFVAPLLEAIGGPLTEHWMRPALILMGESPEAAEREAIGWDTTDIVARPDDTENLRDLHDRILISDEYMLTENGVPVDAMPDDEERTRRLLERIVLAKPELLADPNVTTAMGMDIDVSPVAAGVDAEVGTGGELEAPEPAPVVNALPATQGEEPEVPEGLVAAAELIVYDALSRAGGRLLTNQNRGQFKSTPRHELHTVIQPGGVEELMEGSFQFSDRIAYAFGRSPGQLEGTLRAYTRMLLRTQGEHDRDALVDVLRHVS